MFGLCRTCEPPQAGRLCVSVPEDDDDLPGLGWTIDGCEEKTGRMEDESAWVYFHIYN